MYDKLKAKLDNLEYKYEDKSLWLVKPYCCGALFYDPT